MLESVAALAAMGMAVGIVAALPGGQETLQKVSLILQSQAVVPDPERLLDVFVSPALILGVGLLVAVVTPLIEETVKSLGSWTEGSTLGRLSRSQAFGFGVIAGIGFSFAEALFYGSAGLPQAWANSVLLRSGTTVIHATATGLVALGWYEVWHGRPRRFVLYAGAGIGLHVVWNGLAGLSAVAGLQLFGESAGARALNTGVAALAVGLLAMTLLVAIAGLAALTLQPAQGRKRLHMKPAGAAAASPAQTRSLLPLAGMLNLNAGWFGLAYLWNGLHAILLPLDCGQSGPWPAEGYDPRRVDLCWA